jgi:hypothetical protein
MKFISLNIRLRWTLHGFDENNNGISTDLSSIDSMKFNEVIIPLSNIASITSNRVYIKEEFGRYSSYEYKHDYPDYFEILKGKLIAEGVLIN